MNLGDESLHRSIGRCNEEIRSKDVSRTRNAFEVGLTFPPSIPVVVDGDDVELDPIVGLPFFSPLWSVEGSITGVGKVGVTVTLGVFRSTITGASGLFSFSNIPDDTYTLIAAKDGYTFSNNSQEIIVLNDDEVAVTMASSAVVMSGQIVDGSAVGIEDVLVTITGGQTDTTDVDGNWSIYPVLDGDYTVTPTKTGLTFTPTTRETNIDRENVDVDDFVGSGAIPVTGLVGYWPLLAGSAADQSGKGHDMTIVGTLTANMTDPAGVPNNAHNFTGAQGCWIADHNDFDFGTGAFSLSLWVCTSNGEAITQGPGTLIVKNYDSGQSPAGEYKWDFTVDPRANERRIRFYNSVATPSSGQVADMQSGGLGTGVWKHIVFTRAADGTTYIYYDNVKSGSLTSCSASFSNNLILSIAMNYEYTSFYPWKGGIAHVRIYKGYVLTDADVDAIFDAKL